MRTCILDIETTDLRADFGRIICAVIKEYGTRREPTLYKPVDYRNDLPMLLRLKKRLEQFEVCVTHYGKGFDIPFINTKLLIAEEMRLKKMFHVDTYYISRNKMKSTMSRKSLKALGDTLQIEDQKMLIPRHVWNSARDGDKDSIDLIAERCVSDVNMTEQLYNRLLNSGFIDTLKRY
jgi:uncharacterized protein YprB with RNaseH-like and TPR domain